MLQELTKEDFLDMRKDGLTFKEIGEFYNLTERQVNYRTKKWGLDYSKKKKVDELFFSSGTKAAYYWAGFIASDGSIEEDRNRLSIGIQSIDIDHLVKFKNAIKSDHDICYFMHDKAVRIRFNSEQIVHDLKSIFNIAPAKTYTYTFPKIEEEYLLLEFLRGYIDGDGHYEVRSSNSISIQIASATKIVLQDIVKSVEDILKTTISYNIYHQINKKGECYSLVINTKDSNSLVRKLYEFSTNSTRLDRKYQKIKHLL